MKKTSSAITVLTHKGYNINIFYRFIIERKNRQQEYKILTSDLN